MSDYQEDDTFSKTSSRSGANVIDAPQSDVRGSKKVRRDSTKLSSGSSNIVQEDHVTARHAVREQESSHAKRATSPASITSEEGPLNTPQIENEAADAPNDAAEHATRLNALLSELPNLDVGGQCPPDQDSEEGDALSDTEHSTNPASPTTPPYEYGDTDEEEEFVVGNGMPML